ncbi:MAG: YfiH family protein [Pseudohongiellaceae bacterium]
MKIIVPDWPVPANIAAASTTRIGGVSVPPYASLNAAYHVGDDSKAVQLNRQRIVDALSLPSEPAWLNQTHSTDIVQLDHQPSLVSPADGAITSLVDHVCVVQTADCLPVLICDQSGQQVAAVHAGWRGLADGIVTKAIELFKAPAAELLVWLGPAISAPHFEVGAEVRECFVNRNKQYSSAFSASSNTGRYRADLYQLTRLELRGIGVERIYGGEWCTYQDPARFYSYRRDGQTGRMVSLIYRKS